MPDAIALVNIAAWKRRTITIFLIALVSAAASLSAGPKTLRRIEAFDYAGVRIEGGLLKAQLDEVASLYLAIPDDDLLKGFRARAGLPAPGNDMGGWYSKDVFHAFGQMVSGLARLYAATGDTRFRDKANRLVEEWTKCITPDGYFFFSEHPFARHYIYDKMLWGLLDAHVYSKSPQALEGASRITDWAIRNLDRSRKVNDTACEWYTLSENLYRAYLITGDAKYREFAEVWEYRPYWDMHSRGQDIFATRPDGTKSDVYHAYSHVNTLGGCGAAFLVRGDWNYLAAMTNAYDYFQRAQAVATGGFGPDEQLLPAARRAALLEATHNSFETQCGSWAAFKLCKYLISFTADARFGDWVERLAFNSIGATSPMTRDGRVVYYADYNPCGGRKRNVDIQWSCCTGTRPQAVADLCDLVYFRDEANLYVNLFVPSSVRWARRDGTVIVTQRTQFPENGQTQLEVELEKAARFGIRFRVPGWLSAPMTATVNGREVKLREPAGHWVEIRRRWSSGDKISLVLPTKLSAQAFAPPGRTPVVFTCGPTVLAFDGAKPEALRALAGKCGPDDFIPVPGRPLHYRAASDATVQLRPYYEFREGERYFLFLDPRVGKRIPHTDLVFSGNWGPGGIHRVSNEAGAAVEGEFDGTAIRWLGRRFDDAGMAEVSIDGQVIGTVDQFGAGRDLPFDWSKHKLQPGHHTIRLKVLSSKNEKSANHFINVTGFEVLDE